ncbi:glycoside hydrolase family 71/99-like protein [Ochrovirga pacifica]|uniref:glycoside hydrolase family 71/99-like protein n=1 Tax=Ochrovirga pacifica TaxID=1042376 RepID=UPI000255A558|nr:glycoside hydrolase family 71/99-like protein [Ochrovirga pacifica]
MIKKIYLLAFLFTQYLCAQDLLNHVHTGYQGWFTAKGDNSGLDKWVHWGRGKKELSSEHLTVDMFPDLREYNKKNLYSTSLTYSNGDTVKLFSSNDYETIDLHFKWMQEYSIDGVFLQRFLGPLKNYELKKHRDQVLKHVIKAATKYKRKVAIMYDLSGYENIERKQNKEDFKKFIQKDWESLNKKYDLTEQSCYMHEKQKPVLAIWGLGFNERPFTVRYAKDVLDLFKENPKNSSFDTYLIAGVPSYWRTLSKDSEKNPIWNKLYKSFDMLSPWSVGRYHDIKSYKNYINNVTKEDLKITSSNNIDYMPVVFPGFSWGNLKNESYNSIPRKGGTFLWEQIYQTKKAGAKCIYFAMFDEVDEGTAIFKVAENKKQVPKEGNFVTLDTDGYDLPSDWYLQLANEASNLFNNNLPAPQKLPLK